MSNRPTTLADLDRRRPPPSNSQQRRAGGGGNGGGGRGRQNGLFGGNDGIQEKEPRRENWCDMWTTTFCPNFTIWSFTFLNVLIQLIVFIATIIFTTTTDQGINDHWFLGNSLETLEKFGMRMPYKIKDDVEIYRLFLSLYVNQGFTQIVINILAQLFSGFMLEAQLGSLRMLFFFFIVGISANFFGATVEDKYATGAEPAIFGMFTALAGMYVYYWNEMGKTQRQEQYRGNRQAADNEDDSQDFCRRICGFFMMIILIIIAIFALTSFAEQYKSYSKAYHIAYPDSMGFLGGAIFGFPGIWVFLPPVSGTLKNASRREKGLLIGGLIWSVAIFVVILCVFCFDYDPKEYYWPEYDSPIWDKDD